MADRLHLSPRHRAEIAALLRKHLPDVEVWAYGSRVTGRSHDGSDLDLVLRGPLLQRIPGDALGDFQEAIRDSNIPFLVEAHDWARLPARFHPEIEHDHVVLLTDPMAAKKDVNTLLKRVFTSVVVNVRDPRHPGRPPTPPANDPTTANRPRIAQPAKTDCPGSYQSRESGTGSQRPLSRTDCWLIRPGRVMSIASWIPNGASGWPRTSLSKSRIS